MKLIAQGMVISSVVAITLALSPLGPPAVQSQSMDIFEAARQGRLDRVQAIVESDPDAVHARDESRYTALHWAAIRAQWEAFQLLVESGADPSAVGGDGGTPLHWAAHHDRADMVRLLVNRGADVMLPNQWGRTPLHTAARRGCARVAELLLANGADPNAQTNEGWTALNVAYRSGHSDMVDLLIARGASETIADEDGNLPRDVAFTRPTPTSMTRQEKDEYVGEYDLGGGFSLHVWRVGDQLRFLDFAPDDIDPVGEDEFFCRQEPWRVAFSRDADGRVAGIEVDFLRRTVGGPKVFPSTGGYSYV
ncbi:MAG: ankyrin repeat domain-containing protein, partial [Gemmatimonadetes bacterium]|nr:ankyrin repeat domain-containing protein [Gemmatimonadota bacterium]